ncbi:MAG: aspartate/tyrosine/aromatic aminotransferase [Aureliella sp.]
MFESLTAAPPDPILGLSDAFRSDSRPGKINLTIGVYQDETGTTPVLECVKEAEERLLKAEHSKSYLGIGGLAEFCNQVRELVLGDLVPASRVTVAQTPGGTGALRVAGDFLGAGASGKRLWCSTPTWPNHRAIFPAAGLTLCDFPYLADDKRSLDFAAMMETLERDLKAGDIVVLHGCCHNPTGVDPSPEQWQDIAELTAQRGALPLLDFAYQGFGDGLEADRVGLKAIASQHEEFIVCSSYSKNFGLYGERIGSLMVVAQSDDASTAVESRVKQAIRCNYSNPPRHGGAIVATVLGDRELRKQWEGELAAMRERIHQMRQQFVDAMRESGCDVDFSFLMQQRGMFSFSGLTPLQVDWLKSQHGIYIVGSGRINVAGITPSNLPALSSAIAEALKQ